MNVEAGHEDEPRSRTKRFGRVRRLHAAREFTRVLRGGRRIRGEAFTLVWAPGPGPRPRLGLGIAKRHLRRANARNRVKRAVRETFRSHAAGSVDVVVLNTSLAALRAPGELRAELERLWDALYRQSAAGRT